MAARFKVFYDGGAFVECQMRLPFLLVEGKFYLIVLICRDKFETSPSQSAVLAAIAKWERSWGYKIFESKLIILQH